MISQSGVCLNSVYTYYLRARLQLMISKAPHEQLVKMELAWCFSREFLSRGHNFEELAEFCCLNPSPFSILGFEGQLSALEKVATKPWLSSIAIPTLVITADAGILCYHHGVVNHC